MFINHNSFDIDDKIIVCGLSDVGEGGAKVIDIESKEIIAHLDHRLPHKSQLLHFQKFPVHNVHVTKHWIITISGIETTHSFSISESYRAHIWDRRDYEVALILPLKKFVDRPGGPCGRVWSVDATEVDENLYLAVTVGPPSFTLLGYLCQADVEYVIDTHVIFKIPFRKLREETSKQFEFISSDSEPIESEYIEYIEFIELTKGNPQCIWLVLDNKYCVTFAADATVTVNHLDNQTEKFELKQVSQRMFCDYRDKNDGIYRDSVRFPRSVSVSAPLIAFFESEAVNTSEGEVDMKISIWNMFSGDKLRTFPMNEADILMKIKLKNNILLTSLTCPKEPKDSSKSIQLRIHNIENGESKSIWRPYKPGAPCQYRVGKIFALNLFSIVECYEDTLTFINFVEYDHE